jgi:hypothetical protein
MPQRAMNEIKSSSGGENTFQLSIVPFLIFNIISQAFCWPTLSVSPRISLMNVASLVLLTWKPWSIAKKLLT